MLLSDVKLDLRLCSIQLPAPLVLQQLPSMPEGILEETIPLFLFLPPALANVLCLPQAGKVPLHLLL